MNAFLGKPTSPWDSVAEQMLAAVAIKIELPPSMHALLAERKAAIEKHLERDGSPLKGKVRLFYQQGSVAIGATIRAKFRFEGFDIDIIVELTTHGMTPWQALELLYEAMRGEPGSRYYDMTERQTRCVTIHYADGMHLDLSPAELIDEFDPRRSYIYHSKPEEPRSRDRKVLTNSFGFAEVYNATCPVDLSFQQEYARRALRADQGLVAMQKDADSLPVPAHSSVVGGKSAVTVALQLLKRNRNIRWATRGWTHARVGHVELSHPGSGRGRSDHRPEPQDHRSTYPGPALAGQEQWPVDPRREPALPRKMCSRTAGRRTTRHRIP
jgi:hypothetical protein